MVSELKNMGYGRNICDITDLRSAACIVEYFASPSSGGLPASSPQTQIQLPEPSGTVCSPCPRRRWPTSSSNSLKAHTLTPSKPQFVAPKQSTDRYLVFAQHHCISAHSPVIALGQVDHNDLHSSVLLVEVSCHLVSLQFVVAPRRT